MRDHSNAVLLSVALAAASCGRIGFEAGQAPDANTVPVLDAASRCIAPTVGLVTYYPLDGDARDTVGGADGVVLGGVQYDVGRRGRAAVFDGVDDVIQLPALTNDDFTVAFWVKTTAIASGDLNDLWYNGLGIVDAEVCGSPDGGDWGVALLAGGRVATGAATTDAQVNDGVWHAIVFTREQATDAYALHIDGVLDARTNGPSADKAYMDIPWIGLGNNPCGISRDELWFQGSIDDVRFYDRLLTPDEIATLSASCQ